MRHRAEKGPVQFQVLLSKPAAAEAHLLHPERHDEVTATERALARRCPPSRRAVGTVVAAVLIRHDAYDAVEELMLVEPLDEILIWVGIPPAPARGPVRPVGGPGPPGRGPACPAGGPAPVLA